MSGITYHENGEQLVLQALLGSTGVEETESNEKGLCNDWHPLLA